MKPRAASFILLILASVLTLAQKEQAEPAHPDAIAGSQLSQEQIHALIRQAADKDIENDKKQREYTYIEREEEHKLDGNGKLKSSESRAYEIMVLYDEPVQKLIAK